MYSKFPTNLNILQDRPWEVVDKEWIEYLHKEPVENLLRIPSGVVQVDWDVFNIVFYFQFELILWQYDIFVFIFSMDGSLTSFAKEICREYVDLCTVRYIATHVYGLNILGMVTAVL